MNRSPLRFVFLALALLIAAVVFPGSLARHAAAEVPIPPLSGRIIDQAKVLSATDAAAIEGTLAALQREKGAQIVVLILPSTRPEAIEQYSIRLAEAWRIGRAKVDDGIVLIVAVDDHDIRIEVGYGLEGAVPDAIASRIIQEQVLPHFRNDDYGAGIRAAVDSLSKVIRSEPLPAPEAIPKATAGDLSTSIQFVLLLLLFAGPVAGQFLKAMFGPFFGALVGGVIVFFLCSFAFQWWIAFFLAVLAFFFIMFVGSLGSVSPYGSRSYRGYGGGFGGGYGFGGGRSGGFQGGGGTFGGGGASGKW